MCISIFGLIMCVRYLGWVGVECTCCCVVWKICWWSVWTKSLGQYCFVDRLGVDNFVVIYGGVNDWIIWVDVVVVGVGNWYWFGILNGNFGVFCLVCLFGWMD